MAFRESINLFLNSFFVFLLVFLFFYTFETVVFLVVRKSLYLKIRFLVLMLRCPWILLESTSYCNKKIKEQFTFCRLTLGVWPGMEV